MFTLQAFGDQMLVDLGGLKPLELSAPSLPLAHVHRVPPSSSWHQGGARVPGLMADMQTRASWRKQHSGGGCVVPGDN